MNAWVQIPTLSAAAGGSPLLGRSRRVTLAGLGAGTALVLGVVAVWSLGTPSSARPQPAPSPAAPQPAIAAPAQPGAPAAAAASDNEPDHVRITGVVGPDLTRSLQAAGVPEKQGRAYVAAIASVIDLGTGLSVADRFDLVILRENGRLGELAFAGLDRVGRGDLELMKWSDGRETRWIDADGVDPSSRGMQLPVAGRLSSGFGQRFHPIAGYWRMHKGVDLAARSGTPIVAASDGYVVSAGWRGGYGRQVAISHGDGIETTYSHMSAIAAAAGSRVRQGQVIGYVGSSGLSTGPHLHYEVYKNGRLVNPLSVKLRQSPLQGEELHAFKSRLRSLLVAGA